MLQGLTLFTSTLIVALTTHQNHLLWSAGLTLLLKVIALPYILHRLIRRLSVKWDIETLLNIPTIMLIGIALVVVAFNVAQPISQLSGTITRATIGIALACVLLAFLMMITRSKAVPQVIAFHGDGKRPVLRRHQRHLRHADGRRTGNRARRDGRHGDPRRLLLPDQATVRAASTVRHMERRREQ